MEKILKYHLISFYALFKEKNDDEKAINSAIYYFPGYKMLQSNANYKTYFECFKLILGLIIFLTYLYFFEKLKKVIKTNEDKDMAIKPIRKWICYSTLPFLIVCLILIIKIYNY